MKTTLRGGKIFLFFMFLCEIRTGSQQLTYNALEGEHYILNFLWKKNLDNTGNNTSWYKMTNSKEVVNISSLKNSRIVVKQSSIEFWPVTSNDSGIYSCVRGMETCINATLKVHQRKQDKCYSSLTPRKEIIGKSIDLLADKSKKYTHANYSIVWYKNCKLYESNKKIIHFDSLKRSDAGIYTFVITLTYNGTEFNVSGSTNLILRGSNQSLECEAFIGYSGNAEWRKHWVQMHWVQMNKSGDGTYNEDVFVEECNEIRSITCFTRPVNKEDNIVTMTTTLNIINANEKDIKNPYRCVMSNHYETESKFFILKEKEKSHDISKNTFTKSIAVSIGCSFSIVILVIVCLLFKIDIILLFRKLSGKDETIGDKKEYDAYLAFLNHSTTDEDHRHFALVTLPMILENYFGYKLCLSEREFIPGGALVDDMNNFIEKSRRLILVLGKSKIHDDAFYELETGLHKAMVERKIKMILIEYTPLSKLNVILDSLQLLTTNNRVTWKGKKSHPLKSSFWKKIQYLMPVKPIKLKASFSTDESSMHLFGIKQ
ncbi:interleukin-18 receptor 1 isoform X2 [Xenopus laevis]|uniref:Interleukin-18 receptor 1 isoform X2 n=1 Tax=Xenopus laevis TaxID=8355 RepID=A0A8J1M9C7_XENLA|nr:interleukin-18 receptor 1 isoform X2 [Xenopus laevis]